MVFFCFKKWKPRLIFKQCAICSIAKAITSCSFHRFVLLVCLRACVAGLAMNEIVSCVPVNDFVRFHRYLWQYRNSVISPGLLPDNYYQVKDLYRLFPVRAVEGTWNILAILQSFFFSETFLPPQMTSTKFKLFCCEIQHQHSIHRAMAAPNAFISSHWSTY